MKKPQDPKNCNNSEPEPEKKVDLRGEGIKKMSYGKICTLSMMMLRARIQRALSPCCPPPDPYLQ